MQQARYPYRDQIGLMPSIVAGLEAIDPALVESDYLRGAAVENKQAYISCMPDSEKATLHGELDAEEVRPATPTAAGILNALLLANASSQRPLSAPLLVINGRSEFHPCAMGFRRGITRVQPRRNGPAHRASRPRTPRRRSWRGWIPMGSDRFAGKPAPSNCGTEH